MSAHTIKHKPSVEERLKKNPTLRMRVRAYEMSTSAKLSMDDFEKMVDLLDQ